MRYPWYMVNLPLMAAGVSIAELISPYLGLGSYDFHFSLKLAFFCGLMAAVELGARLFGFLRARFA